MRNALLSAVLMLLMASGVGARAPELAGGAPQPVEEAPRPTIAFHAVSERSWMAPYDPQRATLAAEPFLTQDQIHSYHWLTHTIRLDLDLARRVLAQNRGYFVLKVNGQAIYMGTMLEPQVTSALPIELPLIVTGWEASSAQPPGTIRIQAPYDGRAVDPRASAILQEALRGLNKLDATEPADHEVEPDAPARRAPLWTQRPSGRRDIFGPGDTIGAVRLNEARGASAEQLARDIHADDGRLLEGVTVIPHPRYWLTTDVYLLPEGRGFYVRHDPPWSSPQTFWGPYRGDPFDLLEMPR